MSAFAVVTIIVCAGAIAIGFVNYLLNDQLLADPGWRGRMWFEHGDGRGLDELPDEDAVDAPIPRRPLRGRPY